MTDWNPGKPPASPFTRAQELELQDAAGELAMMEMVRYLYAVLFPIMAGGDAKKFKALVQQAEDEMTGRIERDAPFPNEHELVNEKVKMLASGIVTKCMPSIRHPDDGSSNTSGRN